MMRALVLGILALTSTPGAAAQEGEELQTQASELAKQTQNPVADLTTIPLQFNFTSGGDLDDRTLSLFNFQPVFPLPVNANWHVIARMIVPVLDIPLPDGSRSDGIGDIQGQFFFTPRNGGGITWGLGPVLSLPTATNDAVRTGEFGIGPTAVVVKMTGPWVLGGLANNVWRIAGETEDPDLNQFTLQPFINYNLPRAWSLSTAPIITANWSAPEDQEWTVPLGLGIAKVAAIGKVPINLGLQYYNNVERPDGTGEHTVRLVWAFLFPQTTKG